MTKKLGALTDATGSGSTLTSVHGRQRLANGKPA